MTQKPRTGVYNPLLFMEKKNIHNLLFPSFPGKSSRGGAQRLGTPRPYLYPRGRNVRPRLFFCIPGLILRLRNVILLFACPGAAGEIGKRTGFRSQHRKVCGFESRVAHHFSARNRGNRFPAEKAGTMLDFSQDRCYLIVFV